MAKGYLKVAFGSSKSQEKNCVSMIKYCDPKGLKCIMLLVFVERLVVSGFTVPTC